MIVGTILSAPTSRHERPRMPAYAETARVLPLAPACSRFRVLGR